MTKQPRCNGIDPASLQAYLEGLLPETLDALRQMVQVNSFTHNAAGVNRVGALTRQLFEPLGFTAEQPQAIKCTFEPTPMLGRHLLLTRPGRSRRRIGLVGHLDTVFTEEEERRHDFGWREHGRRIYGPGVLDIKGGNVTIWMMLSAIRTLSPRLFDAVTWCVMFNAAEEGLSSDFRVLQRRRLGSDALANLVFEAGSAPAGKHGVTVQRKGSAGLVAVALGRAAHSGGAHRHGANAIVQLSHFIDRVSALTDYPRELTCNVGMVHGGVTTNRVPDRAEARLELRAMEPQVLDEAIAGVLELDGMSTVASADDGFAARMQVRCVKRNPPWPKNPGSQRLLEFWQQAGGAVGVEVEGFARGGLSDGNFTQDLAPTIDGLGPVGGHIHCSVRSEDGQVDQEFVLRESFVPRATVNVLAVERLVEASGLLRDHGG